jgi:DNA recombination protein RmuC
METWALAVVVFGAIVFGIAIAWLALGGRIAQLRNEAVQAHAESATIRAQNTGLLDRLREHENASTLRENQGMFLQTANETFEKYQTNIAALVGPLGTALSALERTSSQSFGEVSAGIKNMIEASERTRAETSKLSTALRGAPTSRGRWGELTLQTVLDRAGLNKHLDFVQQESYERDGIALRPDVVIHIPGGCSIVVDAKTSLTAYLDAVDASDDVECERHLTRHAEQIREHVKQLASKTYWDGLTTTPDFVAMFVPGEHLFAAAAERDKSLFDDALQKRVLIVTPATMLALAKTVALCWRQATVADNARQVHALGRELYRRMSTMASHIQGCGAALGKAVDSFNQLVGNVERSVMPQVRKFNELEVDGTATEIPALEPIETVPRILAAAPSQDEP